MELLLGQEDLLPIYQAALEDVRHVQTQLFSPSSEPSTSNLLETIGNVGVINISGPLLAQGNEFTRYLGLVSYPDIREALIEAADNSSIEQILLNIDSPGGSAKNIEDVSTLISRISKEVKPVTAYSHGTMASAAYWLAAAADNIYASRLASVGSIGVIATHFDLTGALEQDGVKATVFRAGEFKALGGPHEALSEDAKSIIQTRLETMYDEFINHVALSRQTTTAEVRDKMAKGLEFFGYQAAQNGLIDGVMSLDSMVSKLLMEKGMARKKVLDDKAVAALAAGATVEDALEEAPVVETEAEAEVEVKVEAEAAETDNSLVDYLTKELSMAQSKLLDSAMELRTLQTQVDTMKVTHEQLRSIAEDVVNLRSVALGRSSMSLKSTSDEVLIQQYQQVTEEFYKAYPVGGRCAMPSTETPKQPSVVNMNAVKASRI